MHAKKAPDLIVEAKRPEGVRFIRLSEMTREGVVDRVRISTDLGSLRSAPGRLANAARL